MKNQYYGDINDYRKYGLLRCILNASHFRILIAWMLTQDDGSSDGKFVRYLSEPEKWSRHDPELYRSLQSHLELDQPRSVALIESTSLIPKAKYFSDYVPDDRSERPSWFSQLIEESKECNFVFLDPDNGIEVKSKPYGGKNSSKFLYWKEIQGLWNEGKSLLIYQHFIREKRSDFVQRMLSSLKDNTPNSMVEAFSTPHVVFLMALQPEHYHVHPRIVEAVQESWAGQIKHWDWLSS